MKKTIKLIFSICIFLAVLLSGCAPTPTPLPPTSTPEPTVTPKPTATSVPYNMTIEVVDENGSPIPEAKLIQDNNTEVTDNGGLWEKNNLRPELTINVWAQGYLLQEYTSTLEPGDNNIQIQLDKDPFGLDITELAVDGYELVFVEDFQDNIADCAIEGNGNVVVDDTDSENYLLLADLRNLDESFSCAFGPTNLENAILEVDFRYVDIRFNDFEDDKYYNWQGYFMEFRDGFSVSGYPIHVPWGATLQITDYTEDEWEFPVTVKQGIQESRWYTLSTKYEGEKVEVRMDGLLKFNFLNPPTMISTEPAVIGAFNQSHIQFDNIKMWVPAE